MNTAPRAAWRSWLAAVVCALLIVGAALSFILNFSAGGAIPRERYFRAVFVLRNIAASAAAEEEAIPPRLPYTDATESLLHHPDRIFVLHTLAQEFKDLRKNEPRAALFEAHARLGLGERREAARLLTAYVAESKYHAGQYALLCRTLAELGEYSSLLLICREWFERDRACRSDRIRLTWSALHNLHRYDQASAYMRAEGACLGWQAQIYAAKSALSGGRREEAEDSFQKLLDRHADDAPLIRRFWEQIRDRTQV